MKKVLGTFARIFAAILSVVSICVMLFTVISVLTFNRNDREFLGYKMFIVLSDSMSATNFSAGDLVLTKDVDPTTLRPGDIIAFISSNDENYGQTVTHKIRSLTTTEDGQPGFITYGTTTDTDDTAIVLYSDVLGKYAGHLPKVGAFFNFLKTTPGYILCIFVPFALLILSQAVETVRLFRAYKKEELDELQAERDSLKAQAEETRRMRDELMQMKQQLSGGVPEQPAAPPTETAQFVLPGQQTGADVARQLSEGGEVTLQNDVAFTDAEGHCIDCTVAPGKRAALHLNGCKLKGSIQLSADAALTVDGEGTIQATGRSYSNVGCAVYAKGKGSRAELVSGSYLGGTGACAVCAAGGTVVIRGGSYAVKSKDPQGCANTLYGAGDGRIEVHGGRFVNYDPARYLAPGKTAAVQQTETAAIYQV